MSAAEIVERGIRLGGQASAFAGGEDFVEVVDDECRMGALGGLKVRLDAEMQIHGPAANQMLLRSAIDAGFAISVKPRIPT